MKWPWNDWNGARMRRMSGKWCEWMENDINECGMTGMRLEWDGWYRMTWKWYEWAWNEARIRWMP